MTKTEKIKFGYLISLTLSLIVGVVLLAIFMHTNARNAIIIIDVCILVFGGLGFVLLHKFITVYECPNCKKEFKASIIDVIIGEDKGVNVGKKVTCPHCKKKEYSKVIRK